VPFAAPHPCAHPRCPALVKGSARCDEHTQKQERARGSSHQRGYGATWQRYRASFLRTNPLCVMCTREGRTTAATVVDHIRDHKGAEDLFWDPSNHRALCRPHHDRRLDAGDFGR
jgi:5-methylcytosine-specific restriction protein A